MIIHKHLLKTWKPECLRMPGGGGVSTQGPGTMQNRASREGLKAGWEQSAFASLVGCQDTCWEACQEARQVGPQSLDLEMEMPLVRAVSAVVGVEACWPQAESQGEALWLVRVNCSQGACLWREKKGWQLGEHGREGKVGVWVPSGKDPVHSQEKWATEKKAGP